MKKLILFALAIGGMLLNGCDKDNNNGTGNGTFELDGRTHSVTGAVVYRYDTQPTSQTTNYEVYLLLDGTTWAALSSEDEYSKSVYFDLYFDGVINELPAGTYPFSENDGIFAYGDYYVYSETESVGYDIVDGTLTIGKDGDSYSFSFDGSASYYDDELDDYSSPIPFKCSYSGPVTFVNEDSLETEPVEDESVQGLSKSRTRR